MADGLPVVPPTNEKVEHYLSFSGYTAEDYVCERNGEVLPVPPANRAVMAYQVAVNAVLSGCSADLMPVCIAMVKAMDDEDYLRDISDGSRVPLAFVNGPVGRQVGVDNEQGMTTEEVNVCLGRFIEFALINLAGVAHDRSASFGSVQPLVFSENDEACLATGWQPYHVQQGYGLNDSAVTMSSFAMWGNNSTPATDWPEEIMKLVAWDATEKNLGGLGAADSETYAETKRTILVTGDASRNKTQVMPGGKSVIVALELPEAWASLLASLQRKELASCLLQAPDTVVAAPVNVPSVLTAGTYRILDPATGARYLTREGRLYFDSTSNTLHYYPVGGSQADSAVLDSTVYAAFIAYVENLGYNSSFTVSAGAVTDAVVRFSSNAMKLENNTVALTQESFAGSLTLQANNTPNSNAAGGVAVSGSRVRLSASVTSFDVDLDGGRLVVGETSTPGFITLTDTTVTVDTNAPAGSTALIGVLNGDGSYRTLTFAMRANGTYDMTYNDRDTLSLADSTVALRWTAGAETTVEAFAKTDVPGVYMLTRRCGAGSCRFGVSVANALYGSPVGVTNSCDRLQLSVGAGDCTLELADADYYTFRFDSRDGKLTLAKDVTRAGLCTGGTIENISGVYVIRPNGDLPSVELSNLSDNPAFAVAVNGALIPGAAFEGLAEGTAEGAFSLALKPPVLDGVQAGDGTDGFSVSVETFENLRYVLKRATDLNGAFVPVDTKDAEKIGTGRSLKLIDASLDRPPDRAFYRVGVSIPSKQPVQ